LANGILKRLIGWCCSYIGIGCYVRHFDDRQRICLSIEVNRNERINGIISPWAKYSSGISPVNRIGRMSRQQ
jgi:hypothetical protein